MKKPSDVREKQLKKILDRVVKDNVNIKERIKVCEKRLDFFQDQVARTAVEMQAIQQSVGFIIDVASKIAKEEQQRINPDAGIG